MITIKQCSKCTQLLPLGAFHKHKNNKDGLAHWCKKCSCESAINWYRANSERAKENNFKYRKENLEKIKKHELYYRKINLKKCLEQDKKRTQRWKIKNPEKAKNVQRKANAKYRRTIKGYISKNIGTGIWRSLHKNKNGAHWESLVGYTMGDLKKRLIKTIPKGYTLQDYIKGKLHIDHIIPISAFNYQTAGDLDFKQCWGLKNLQLLPATDNMSKKAKIKEPFQPSLQIHIG
jgi:hypothetical protein